MSATPDPVALAARLIRCPSVTPRDAGALGVVQAELERLGFACHRLEFAEPGGEPVDNLYARFGAGAPSFCFAGHVDVVPPGDESAWSSPPFAGTVAEGALWGRGAADMKGAVACFVAAAQRFLAARGEGLEGAISLLITGDEEGPAVNGTAKVLRWMGENGEKIDACLVGEPTNPRALGEMIKIGRRGSLTGRLTVTGIQGHVAYPALADNPVPRLVRTLSRLIETRLDSGSDHFPPSNLEVTTVDVGNPAENVIPATARATFNIRFNDCHQGSDLKRYISEIVAETAGEHRLDISVGGEAFLTPPGPLSDLVAEAVERVTGRRPVLGTTGGTSDARFIKDHCPVVEFGLAGGTMHKVDEHVSISDLHALTDIYVAVLEGYFKT